VSEERVDAITTGDWWVLQTMPKREPLVCRQLAIQGLDHYAPELPPCGRTRLGSVRHQRRRMIFPGYVFCRPAESACAHVAVKWAPGVVRVLGDGDTPARVSDAVVRHIRRRVAEQAAGVQTSGFRNGQRVLIESGPLASLDAIFDRDLNASARVRILVEMMGRTVPMDIAGWHLRAAAS
jgi:transcription antitermination factor NusG